MRRDNLNVAWEVSQRRPVIVGSGRAEDVHYKSFLSLIIHLSLAVPSMIIPIPIGRASQVMGRRPATLRKYRDRAIEDGFIRLVKEATPSRHGTWGRPAEYAVDIPCATELPVNRQALLPTEDPVAPSPISRCVL